MPDRTPEPVIVSEMDAEHLAMLRENVRALLRRAAERFAGEGSRLLDVAPQVHEGARPYFPPSVQIDTLDIDPRSGCTFIGDLCETNVAIPDARYDFVVCTEVLEHVLQPFDAVAEIRRVLRPGGLLIASAPFNFRIHGPLPDCWRFTEHGWRSLLRDFQIEWLEGLPTPGRALMPVHYTVVARRTP
jgi:SAM-dependent methyltransferase